MKKFKKAFAIVLALAVVLSMSVAPTFAAGDGTITINNAVSGHTYTAYQIFKGDLSGATLSNVKWGDDITAAGKTALETAYNATGPQAVADAVAEEKDAVVFADHVGTNVSGGKAGSLSGTTYTISGLEDGYYMIVDTYTPAANEENVTYSRYMVQLVGTATVNNKAEKPTVDKKIVDGEKRVENNTANIGDTITYEITSAVPDMTGYKEYYMDFSDTLSKGLTYDNGSLKVYVGDTELNADNYTVTVGDYDATSGTAIAVHLKDLKSRSTGENAVYTQDATIRITYTAKVNDAAVIGNTGNPNTVTLDYTNKPSDSGDGTPDNEEDVPHGTTPSEEVKTFVTEIELTKVDMKDKSKLAGAVFNVKGTQINKVLIKGEHFVANAEGNYYLLKEGTYTTTVPTDNTKDKYAMEGENYQRFNKEAYATTSVQEEANVEFQVVTGSDGVIKVTGLKEGTYTFTEIQAPDGYNLLPSPLTVVVESNIDQVSDTVAFAWSKGTASTADVTVDNNGVFKFTVENGTGAELPSTGGIGTTIFYVLGALLVVGAGVLLVTRRRMKTN